METSLRIGRIWGVEIGVSWSWFLVVALVVWSLAVGFYPVTYPDLDAATHVVMALVTAVLFFGSVLLHELGHARRAVREGVPIDGITLWLFGGVAKIHRSPPSAGAAFRVAVAGPVVSVALVLLFGALAFVGAQADLYDGVQGVVDYLARVNLLVLLFNLVPALPLDGGRMLQAGLWHRSGDFTSSTVQAATAGRWFGYLLVGLGVASTLGGAGIGGLWLAFIGWFLVQAASIEAAQAQLRRALGHVLVRQAMTPNPSTVPPDITVEDFMDHVGRTRHTSYPVTGDGRLLGLATVEAAAAVPGSERADRRVAEVMTPRDELATVDADRELAEVVDDLQAEPEGLVVTDHGRVVGLLTPSDVRRAVTLVTLTET